MVALGSLGCRVVERLDTLVVGTYLPPCVAFAWAGGYLDRHDRLCCVVLLDRLGHRLSIDFRLALAAGNSRIHLVNCWGAVARPVMAHIVRAVRLHWPCRKDMAIDAVGLVRFDQVC